MYSSIESSQLIQQKVLAFKLYSYLSLFQNNYVFGLRTKEQQVHKNFYQFFLFKKLYCCMKRQLVGNVDPFVFLKGSNTGHIDCCHKTTCSKERPKNAVW